jgi:hypothetical protein
MADRMNYPKNPIEFVKDYSFKDTEELYTNGADLVPVFRVEQMLEHYMPDMKNIIKQIQDEYNDIVYSDYRKLSILDFYGFVIELLEKYKK